MGLLTPQDLRRVADALEARGVEANTIFSHDEDGPIVLLRPEDWKECGLDPQEGRTSGDVTFWREKDSAFGVVWTTNFPTPEAAELREAV